MRGNILLSHTERGGFFVTTFGFPYNIFIRSRIRQFLGAESVCVCGGVYSEVLDKILD